MMTRAPALAVVVLLFTTGCPITSRTIIERFNARPTPQKVTFEACEASLPALVPDMLSDVYDTPEAMRVFDAMAADALTDAAMCLRATSGQAGRPTGPCLTCLFTGRQCNGARSLQFPPPPLLDSTDLRAWHVERDVQRVQQHLQQLLKALNQRCLVNGQADLSAEARGRLRQGFSTGLSALLEYQARRNLVRAPNRPITTWVLSGGAANGAFSAGAAWWLMQQHRSGGPMCQMDRVDMLGGASAGTLVATLVKKYFDGANRQDAAQQQAALDLLTDSFTCAANQDLYCVQDASLGDLLRGDGTTPRGLVSFNGVRSLLDRNLDPQEIVRPPEQFSSTVEFLDGDAQFFSSALAPSKPDWIAAIEGSVVQPLIAEPVPSIFGRRGVWIDGGIRSGLPLTVPLRRGADRALVFVNTALNGVPRQSLPSAASIGFRALDLFALQPIVGELASSELEATVKRALEKERCLDRLGAAYLPDRARELDERCGRSTAAPLTIPEEMPRPRQSPDSPMQSPSAPLCTSLAGTSDGYLSSWLFMPERLPDFAGLTIGEVSWNTIAAVGYEFNTTEMWNLFVLGALTASERCVEINETLGWHLPPSCADRRAVIAGIKKLRQRWEEKRCFWNKPRLVDCPK